MILLEDTRQQIGKHKRKRDYFIAQGIEIRRTKLYVGDYTLPNKQDICVDTKMSINELISDICGKQHDRFRAELERAKEANIQLYVLVEDGGGYVDKSKTIYNPPVRDIKDLFKWKNPRLFLFRNGKQRFPTATRGSQLAKACLTMQLKYGVEFLFCKPEEAGQRVIDILRG